MVDTTLEIYKQNVPMGIPKIVKDTWNSASKPEIQMVPESGYILLVRGVSWLFTQDFELSVGSMRMEHSKADGSNVYPRLDFAEANELLAMSNQATILVEHPVSTNELVGAFDFQPPIRCRASQSEYFTIIEEGTLTVVGDIFITVHGWQIEESEYDET